MLSFGFRTASVGFYFIFNGISGLTSVMLSFGFRTVSVGFDFNHPVIVSHLHTECKGYFCHTQRSLYTIFLHKLHNMIRAI